MSDDNMQNDDFNKNEIPKTVDKIQAKPRSKIVRTAVIFCFISILLFSNIV